MHSHLRPALVVAFLALASIEATASVRAAGPWYVAPSGTATNNCQSPSAPCPTINAAILKASPGDTIFVANGTYTGSGDQVVLVDKTLTLSGGWNATFTAQAGTSIIDGQGARRGIMVSSSYGTLDRLTVSNGSSSYNSAGIFFYGGMGSNWIVNNSVIRGNAVSNGLGGGICFSYGTLTVNSSAIISNTAKFGGGISSCYSDDFGGTLYANNSTISGNTAETIGGIFVRGMYGDGVVSLSSSTLANNVASSSGAGGIGNTPVITLSNTLLAGNMSAGSRSDCQGSVSSLGYNLVENTSGCTIASTTGDLLNVTSQLMPLVIPQGYHPLPSTSPAVDGGNPAGCKNHLGQLLTSDQRGAVRPWDGNGDGSAICDIGAYEYRATRWGTSTAVSSSANPSDVGQSVTFTAAVTSGLLLLRIPTGTVQFTVDGANLGAPAALAGGHASISTAGLALGTHAVSAVYSGDANFAPSSGTLTGGQMVGRGRLHLPLITIH